MTNDIIKTIINFLTAPKLSDDQKKELKEIESTSYFEEAKKKAKQKGKDKLK